MDFGQAGAGAPNPHAVHGSAVSAKMTVLKHHMSVLTVSVGQESGYSFARSSVHGLTRLQSRCSLGCVLTWRLDQGRICFRAHSVRGEMYFLRLCG